ncbi:excisionase family DNA binding protein [Jatrophihabitans sp. GAS493]|uniref:excisionase family DNA-binding protein n=1 Tax=Jatrophihabitans sp. GAS493 TaxID=1907575 RepID=UPI000BB7A485|nr:excisionase family DNA-binding protein [Jatrophihabitans sp. GAS493]SOD71657.1 excisionase family DNA binding protein [Jatrophihabitans sp. GAS493]
MNAVEIFPGVAAAEDTSAEVSYQLLLSIEQAAQRLGVGRSLMYALVAAGEVESVRIGRLRRVPNDALATYVSQLRKTAQAS